jgi:hypothetical protein
MSNRLDQEREKELEPVRMESCKKKLEELGYKVEAFGGNRLQFLYEGKLITFYPYSGWFSGKMVTDGRGFKKLLSQL